MVKEEMNLSLFADEPVNCQRGDCKEIVFYIKEWIPKNAVWGMKGESHSVATSSTFHALHVLGVAHACSGVGGLYMARLPAGLGRSGLASRR